MANVDVPITATIGQTEPAHRDLHLARLQPTIRLASVVSITAGEPFCRSRHRQHERQRRPRLPTGITVNVTNQGNVDTNFALTALLAVAAGLDGRVAGAITNGHRPWRETVSLEVTVTPAHISAPLNPAERNQEDDLVDLWQAHRPSTAFPSTTNSIVRGAGHRRRPRPRTRRFGTDRSGRTCCAVWHRVRCARADASRGAPQLINDVNELVNATVAVSDVRFTSYGGAGGFAESPAGPSRLHR